LPTFAVKSEFSEGEANKSLLRLEEKALGLDALKIS
jgi:hypothetical protein